MDEYGNLDHADVLEVWHLAAPVADLIVADDIEEFTRLAKEIHQKRAAAEAPAPAAPAEPPVERLEDGTAVYRQGLSLAPEAAPVVRGSITEADLRDSRGMPSSEASRWDAFWRSTTEAGEQ